MARCLGPGFLWFPRSQRLSLYWTAFVSDLDTLPLTLLPQRDGPETASPAWTPPSKDHVRHPKSSCLTRGHVCISCCAVGGRAHAPNCDVFVHICVMLRLLMCVSVSLRHCAAKIMYIWKLADSLICGICNLLESSEREDHGFD